MHFLMSSSYLSAVLVEAQKCLEVTENLVIVVATIALVAAFLTLHKGA